ncbi:MAG: prolyl-tRNA synthetase [Deltaproteobacteria bacterium]|nr:prolyl-tRNA synthetase [Deltaproteobacteria bacterium]
MRYTKYFIPTYKEMPAEAEVISHQLMLRAGMIRKLTSGVYTFLPIGLKSLRKVETIIREEMNRSGGIEVLMPAVHPSELWKESGRWDYYGPELLRFRDRNNHEACLAPTHEEVITDLVRREIHSYKQLPVNFYQIQFKFRDEIRPRFGVMRCREFIMKDGYTFDVDEAGADRSYEIMRQTYSRIFQRCGLKFKIVDADSGSIGGSFSQEYMVLADTGEDQIVTCSKCEYAANMERAEVKWAGPEAPAATGTMKRIEEVSTPNMRTVEEVTSFLSVSPQELVKTLIFKTDTEVVAALIRGDHEVNEVKLKNLLGADSVELAEPALVAEVTGAPMGFAGPVGLKVKRVADNALKGMADFVTGGNKHDVHFIHVNLGRDFQADQFADLRLVMPGDFCPRCKGELEFKRGIEVGHIFKLGTKYSKPLHAVYLDEKGEEKVIIMGTYGIGVARTLAAAIEQNHDADGMIFPVPIAPFEVVVLPLQIQETEVAATGEKIYREIQGQGLDVLIDDRDVRPGVKFKDADLLGIPVRINVGARNLKNGRVEMKLRTEAESVLIPTQEAPKMIAAKVKELYDSIK